MPEIRDYGTNNGGGIDTLGIVTLESVPVEEPVPVEEAVPVDVPGVSYPGQTEKTAGLPSDLEDIIHTMGDFERPLNIHPFNKNFAYKIGWYDPETNDTTVLEGVEKKVGEGSTYTIYELSLPNREPFVIVDKSLVGRVFFYSIPYDKTTKLIGFNDKIPELEKEECDFRIPVVSSKEEYWKHLYTEERRRNEAGQGVKYFLESARHELKNNLGAIRDATTLISGPQNQDDSAFINMIYTSANDALAIVEQLRVDSISNGIYTTSPNDGCDITEVVEQIRRQTTTLMAKYNKQHLEIIYDIDGIPETFVRASEKNLTALLYNLVNNAIKYTDNGTIKIRVNAAESHYILEVSDTGIGIPANFDPFEPKARADNVGSREGSGLGLAIVKKIVNGYGGRISYTSKVGVGTAFRVELPSAISR